MEKHAAHSSSASSMTARSGSAPASSARSMAGGGGGGGGAAEGGARKVLARSTSFGEFVEADDDVADAGDDVEPRAAGGGGGGGGAARGFRASSAGPVPTLPSGADGAAGGGHHAGGVARAAAMRRSATSPEGVLQRPGTALGTGGASELKALRQSKSFAGGDSGAGGLLMSPMLETVREEGRPSSAHWHEGLMLSRGGMHRPKSAYIFSMDKRPEVVVGDGATVPYHYLPPGLLARDPTTLVKNTPKVPFPQSTRDQWQAVHMAVTSSPNAGPGSYELKCDPLSTKRISRTQSFTLAKRQLGAAVPPGPAPYSIGDRTLKAFYPRMPEAVMATAGRPSDKPLPESPGPIEYGIIRKHRPFIRFSTAPGHDVPPGDVTTAAIPIRDAHRVRKHKPMVRFSSAPRFGNSASTF